MDRAYRRIMSELIDEIVTARIASGEWLPRVEDIAARHAVSVGAAREAVRALEERRLVAVHYGQGQQVLGRDEWALLDHDVLEAVLRGGDTELLREAVDALRLFETQAAMLAAPRVTDGDLAQLGGLLEPMRDAGERFAAAEWEFHRTLAAIAQNRFLASALEPLQAVIPAVRLRRAADRNQAVIRLHETILAALGERDRTAAAAALDDYGRHLASWLRV
jgi:GntR family transcriptional regulator, transcriptional repressor for pyruvate dehydrogenase complex